MDSVNICKRPSRLAMGLCVALAWSGAVPASGQIPRDVVSTIKRKAQAAILDKLRRSRQPPPPVRSDPSRERQDDRAAERTQAEMSQAILGRWQCTRMTGRFHSTGETFEIAPAPFVWTFTSREATGGRVMVTPLGFEEVYTLSADGKTITFGPDTWRVDRLTGDRLSITPLGNRLQEVTHHFQRVNPQ